MLLCRGIPGNQYAQHVGMLFASLTCTINTCECLYHMCILSYITSCIGHVFVITGQPVRTARRYVYVSDMYLYVIVWVYFVYNKWYR